MITKISRKGAEMTGATPSQISKLNPRALIRSLDNDTLYDKLGIDPKAPGSPEWWYPVLDRALQQFTVGLCSENAPENPAFASPFLEVLEEFVQDLSGDSAAPRSFTEFGLYPPQPMASNLALDH